MGSRKKANHDLIIPFRREPGEILFVFDNFRDGRRPNLPYPARAEIALPPPPPPAQQIR